MKYTITEAGLKPATEHFGAIYKIATALDNFQNMRIIKADGKFKVCLSAKELTLLLVAKFFKDLFKKIKEGSMETLDISIYIKQLSDHSVDSIDYEFFTSILDLYEQ